MGNPGNAGKFEKNADVGSVEVWESTSTVNFKKTVAQKLRIIIL